jgi:hypothetical protein
VGDEGAAGLNARVRDTAPLLAVEALPPPLMELIVQLLHGLHGTSIGIHFKQCWLQTIPRSAVEYDTSGLSSMAGAPSTDVITSSLHFPDRSPL